jgi:hypothetical protein
LPLSRGWLLRGGLTARGNPARSTDHAQPKSNSNSIVPGHAR